MISMIIRLSVGWIGYCRTDAGLWALTLPQAGEDKELRKRVFEALNDM